METGMARKYVRILVICAVVATMLLSVAVAPRPSRAASGSRTVPGEVVVKLLNASDLPAVAQDFALDPLPIDQIGSYSLYRLGITDGTDPEVKAAALLSDPQRRVIYAEANEIGQDPEGQARITWSSGGDAGVYGTQ